MGSETEFGAFHDRFVAVGYTDEDIDPRIFESLMKVHLTAASVDHNNPTHESCKDDGESPKYYSFQNMMRKGDGNFVWKIKAAMDYFKKPAIPTKLHASLKELLNFFL